MQNILKWAKYPFVVVQASSLIEICKNHGPLPRVIYTPVFTLGCGNKVAMEGAQPATSTPSVVGESTWKDKGLEIGLFKISSAMPPLPQGPCALQGTCASIWMSDSGEKYNSIQRPGPLWGGNTNSHHMYLLYSWLYEGKWTSPAWWRLEGWVLGLLWLFEN